MTDWTDEDQIDPTDCVTGLGSEDTARVWPEHDFQSGLTECTRCGAEAEPEPDAGYATGELVFKGLATFVFSGALYFTYWTAAHLLITEFLLLTLFDIFMLLSWFRAYARTQIRVYDFRTDDDVDQDPGEL